MTGNKEISVAVIGLGSMGLGMARSLLRAGHAVSGYDLDEAANAALVAAGGRAGNDPADAAGGTSIVVIVVVNAAQTETALLGHGGVLSVLAAGSVVISSATMDPRAAKALAVRCAERGVHYLDAPMSGGASRAGTGELTFMASGTPEAFVAAMPALRHTLGTSSPEKANTTRTMFWAGRTETRCQFSN